MSAVALRPESVRQGRFISDRTSDRTPGLTPRRNTPAWPGSTCSRQAAWVTDFTHENLTGARFEDVYLTGADFRNVDLTELVTHVSFPAAGPRSRLRRSGDRRSRGSAQCDLPGSG